MTISPKAALLWLANAFRWLLVLFTLATYAFIVGGSENMDAFSDRVVVDSDSLYALHKMTWDGPCGTMHYGRGSEAEQSMDYCSSGWDAAFLLGLAALAPTPMLVPAALFALGGYATEDDIRTYYLPFYNSESYSVFRVSHSCEWFECDFRIRPEFDRGDMVEPNIAYHYPYPQSHLWWYWASAACSLAGVVSRPLGAASSWAFLCQNEGSSWDLSAIPETSFEPDTFPSRRPSLGLFLLEKPCSVPKPSPVKICCSFSTPPFQTQGRPNFTTTGKINALAPLSCTNTCAATTANCTRGC